MNIALQKDIYTEAYKDVEDLIRKICWNFKKVYGGNFDDLFSEANIIFIKAFDSYNDNKGKFSTWINTKVVYGLTETIRQKNKEDELLEQYLINNQIKTESLFKYDFFFEIVEAIQIDAKEILDIILDPPKELQKQIDQRKNYKYPTINMLKKYAIHKLGWTARRVEESFQEIRSIIND